MPLSLIDFLKSERYLTNLLRFNLSILPTLAMAFAPIQAIASTVLSLELNQKNTSQFTTEEPAQFDTVDQLIFAEGQHIVLDEALYNKLPADHFSVHAHVQIDKPQDWGGIVGRFQDNGQYERGWLLGYNGTQFSFILSTGGRFIKVAAPTDFILGQSYHLTATYDGKKASLYINGKLAGLVSAPGKIVQPDIPTQFVIGAFKDKNEFFALDGRIEQVELFDHILDKQALAKQLGSKSLAFAVRPSVSFLAPGTALVRWESSHPGVSQINFGTTRELGTVITSDSADNHHRILLTNLEPATEYFYRIAVTNKGKRIQSPPMEFDTTMNYMPVAAPAVLSLAPTEKEQKAIDSIVSEFGSGFSGHALILGGNDGRLAYGVAQSTRLKVTIVERDADKVKALRDALYATGVYGTRISVMHVPSDTIPLGSCIANLILSEHTLAGQSLPYSQAEAKRLTRPDGGRIITSGFNYTRPKLEGSGDWTHQYGSAANTSYVNEALGEIDDTADTIVQWLGRPGADFGIDRQNRISAPLAISGRTYLQGLNRVIGLDAYNGEILWSKEIPDLRRMNVPHDCANWCADADNIYMAVADRAWIIDAQSGERVANLKLTTQERDPHDWGYIANNDSLIFGSTVLKGSHVTDFWGRDKWYDKVGQKKAIEQTCSDKIFAYSKAGLKGLWAYERGLIINATITLEDNKLYFLECRDPAIKADSIGRVADNGLWLDTYVVCLNAQSGDKLWDSKLPAFDYLTKDAGFLQTVYGQMSHRGYLLVASEGTLKDDGQFSGTGKYVYLQYDKFGNLAWKQKTAWSRNNHGGHIVHPVMFEDAVYVYPHAVDLNNGEVLPDQMSGRSGCPTLVGFKNGLFQRGSAPGAKRALCIWSKNTKENTGWGRLRPSCWLNFLPTQGMVIMSEGGGGCSCGGWIETSIALIPTTHTK